MGYRDIICDGERGSKISVVLILLSHERDLEVYL